MARHAEDLSTLQPSDVFVDMVLGMIYRIDGETLYVMPRGPERMQR